MSYLAGRHLSVRALIVMLVLAATLVLITGRDNRAEAAGTFDPTIQFFLCNQLPAGFGGPAQLKGDPDCESDLTPSGSPPFGFRFSIPQGDLMFSSFAIFVSEGFDIASDAEIDDGTVIGGVTNTVNIGLLNNPCGGGGPLSPEFILYESTTNTANPVDPLPVGTPNRFSNLVNDDDSFFGKADGDSPAVLQYPSFLNILLDPDLDYPGGPNADEPPIQPHARYTGLTQVAGEWTFLSILVFEKSQLAPFAANPNNATNPIARFARNPDETGWVHMLVFQDPSQIVLPPSGNTDSCTPIEADAMLLGAVTDTTHGAVDRFTSPAAGSGIDGAGTHPLLLYGMSERDTDGDGLDNTFDTCPWQANTQDPRVTSGVDGDMIDPVCDPTPTGNTNLGDHDSDGYYNAGDNCPLHSNAGQAQAEMTSTYISAAPDAGPKSDYMGDVCDGATAYNGTRSEDGAGPNTCQDGEDNGGDTVKDLADPDCFDTIAGNPAVANGAFIHDMNTAAVCIGGTDAEPADGFCDSGGLDANDIDTDGDGYENFKENFMQTDPLVDCPQVLGKHDAWPPDFNMSRSVNILDIVQLTPPTFNTAPPSPNYSQRKDLNASDSINILDIVLLTPPVFNSSCTP